MDQEMLESLKATNEKYGTYLPINEEFLYVTMVDGMFGRSSCICYGPLPLWNTCGKLEDMAISACTENDEGYYEEDTEHSNPVGITFAGFMCKDNWGDIYTFPLAPCDLDYLKTIVENPDLLYEQTNIKPGVLIPEWRLRKQEYDAGLITIDKPSATVYAIDGDGNIIK